MKGSNKGKKEEETGEDDRILGMRTGWSKNGHANWACENGRWQMMMVCGQFSSQYEEWEWDYPSPKKAFTD